MGFGNKKNITIMWYTGTVKNQGESIFCQGFLLSKTVHLKIERYVLFPMSKILPYLPN